MSGPACPWQEAARRWPRAAGLVSASRAWTFSEWDDEISRRTAQWTSLGWRRGDRVGLCDRGTPEFLFSLASAMRAGMVACITSPRWTAHQLAQAARCTDWRGWIDREDDGTVAPRPQTPAPDQDDPLHLDNLSSLSTILFSSGSSGAPKAIAHRLESHLASAAGACENLPLGAGDRWPISLPMSHVSGLGILFRCLHAGAAILLPDHHGLLESQLGHWRASHLSLVPTQLKRLLDQGLASPPGLRGVLVGGASMPPGLMKRARALNWPIVTTYGLTEMASQVTATSLCADDEELATCGRVLRGRELRISPQGEILVRGRTRFEGFVQNGTLLPAFDADGWYATGDLGLLDSHQRLLVTGRLDQMFISGGENCYPEEIENCLLEIPEIRAACVVAVPHPEYGQRPFAFVDAEAWQPARWRTRLADILPRFKIPDHFAPWPPDVPLKPSRRRLSELAAQQLVAQPGTGPPATGAP